MTDQQAHNLVAISIVVMLGYGLVSGKGVQVSTYKQIWGILALGFFLSLISDFVPQVGGPLALVFALAFIAGGQTKMLTFVNNAIGKKEATSNAG